MAYKSTTFTSGGQGGARLIVEQTGVNTSYATLTAYVQILRSAADSYSAPAIDFTSVDSGYIWYGSKGNMSGTNWQTVFTKTGILVYYTGSSTTRSFTVAARGTFTYDATEEGGDVYTTSYNISGTFELYPRSTPPPVVNPSISVSSSSCTLGNSITITTANGSAANITVKVGSYTATIVSSAASGSRPWTPDLATYAPKITSGSSATATLSWNGASTNVTLSVPNNSSTAPTCTATIAVVNGLSGLYVKGKSQAKVTITASTKYSATVSSYVITIDGGTYSSNPATSSTLTTAGSRSYSAYIKDSRGFTSSTVSGTFTVTDYASPTIGSISIYRSNSSGTADNNGTYIAYKFTPTISALGNNNLKKYYLQYKTESASSWSSAGSGTLSAYTGVQSFVSGNILSATTVYQARVGIEDSYGVVYSATVVIPTAAVIMDFNNAGTGGGVGMYTQNANFWDVAWSLIPHNGIAPVGSNNSSTQPGTFYIVPHTGESSGDITNLVKAFLRKAATSYPGKTLALCAGTVKGGSYEGWAMAMLYNISSTYLDSTGLPAWTSGILLHDQGFKAYCFGTGAVSGGAVPFTLTDLTTSGSAATHISGSGSKSATTSYSYSGVSFTVPAGKYFTVTAHAYYSSVSPAAVCISSSSSSVSSGAMQVEGLVDSQNTRARVTWSGYLSAATTYYIWVKSQTSGTVGVGVDGFYL